MMPDKNFKKRNSSEVVLEKLDTSDKVWEKLYTEKELIKKVAVSSTCGDVPDCSQECANFGTSIAFTAYVTIPNGFVLTSASAAELAFNSGNLKCLVESCTQTVSIPNPCDSNVTISNCTVNLRRRRLIGSISYVISVAPIASTSSGGGNSAVSTSGSVSVNQIVSYTCDCNVTCPDTIGITPTVVLNTAGAITLSNGDVLVPVNVALTFTV